jgi:hypothetical protein
MDPKILFSESEDNALKKVWEQHHQQPQQWSSPPSAPPPRSSLLSLATLDLERRIEQVNRAAQARDNERRREDLSESEINAMKKVWEQQHQQLQQWSSSPPPPLPPPPRSSPLSLETFDLERRIEQVNRAAQARVNEKRREDLGKGR